MSCRCDDIGVRFCNYCVDTGRADAADRDLGPVARLKASERALTPVQREVLQKLRSVNRAWMAGTVEIPRQLLGQRVKVRVEDETWTINFPADHDQMELPGVQRGMPEAAQGWLDSLL